MFAEFKFNLPLFGQAHAMILVLITYVQRSSVNAHAENVYIRARDLNFRLSYIYSYILCMRNGKALMIVYYSAPSPPPS